jgi:hypothetical protein
MERAYNEIAIALALLGVGVYFTIQGALLIFRFMDYKRHRSCELLTWPARRLPYLGLYRGLGVASAVLAGYNAMSVDRMHNALVQVVMAIYFLALAPLVARIRPGFYRDGIWAESEFLAYERIGRFAFLERPEIMLVIMPRGKKRAVHLGIPAAEYGAARKLLHGNVADPETAILGI